MNDILPKKPIAILSLILIQILVQVILYMFLEIKTSFAAYKVITVFNLIVYPIIFFVLYCCKKLVKKVAYIWNEIPSLVHFGIILFYSGIIYAALFGVIFPAKKIEYEKNIK